MSISRFDYEKTAQIGLEAFFHPFPTQQASSSLSPTLHFPMLTHPISCIPSLLLAAALAYLSMTTFTPLLIRHVVAASGLWKTRAYWC